MKTTINIPAEMGAKVIESALEGLARLSTDEHSRYRLPQLYKSGVRYQREVGTENWQTPRELIRSRRGDCEDLAAYRVGELRASGADRGARVQVVRTGPRTMHAIVLRSSGIVEDPSRALGMQGRDGSLMRPTLVVGVEPGHTWAEWKRKGSDWPIVSGATLQEVLGSFDEVGAEVGFLPVLDILSRAAGGALQAVVPGMGPQAQGPQAQARPSPQLAQQVARGLDVSTADVLSMASALARVVQQEKARSIRAERAERRR